MDRKKKRLVSGPDERPAWKHFESAVAAFVQALDPAASVRHNILEPDRDTSRLRQRDVLVDARICEIFPVRVLISCKRYARRLHQADIDAFLGELLSSRAHKGVIYSHSGFTGPALEKARARGVCCCRLYDNEHAELPPSISFEAFCLDCSVRLSAIGLPSDSSLTWGELLEPRLLPDREYSLLDVLCQRFQAEERDAAAEITKGMPFPPAFEASIDFALPKVSEHVRVKVIAKWNVYRARMDAFLVKGSYSFTTNEFAGQFSTPSIDMMSSNPGQGWERLEQTPSQLSSRIVFVRYGAKLDSAVREALWDKRVVN